MLFNNSYVNEYNQPIENSRNQNNIGTSAGADFENLQKARKDLVEEIRAIIQYDDHIHSSTDRVAKGTWEDIKNEELNHVGQLLALIDYLDPTQEKFVTDGINEFKNRFKQN